MVALIGKSNDKGLGILTREWAEHIDLEVWCKKDPRTQKVEGFNYFDDDREIDLKGIKTVVLLETPFQRLIKRCKDKGIKTILKVNYEFLPSKLEYEPDMYLCSSLLNYQHAPQPKILIADPVNTEKIKFRERKEAKTFLHIGGITLGDANGTQDFLKAIPLVTADVKFIIRSQKKLNINDPRVDLRVGSVPNYWDLYDEGDVFVSPQRFRATSLPIQEAMASGLPVLCTDIKPFNEFVSYTFPPKGSRREYLSRMIDYHELDPKDIAQAINDLAGKSVIIESNKSREYAESISWKKLTKEIKNLL